ncbi:hypothetical protein IEN85_08055 [Pelagicoccus sp. NFK12]|uniref:TonB C-terminal domain-containing protein n=1 Tax=Pelagicoccus enzymogenes TaxID=2773457 RepID=A0A927IHH1_9BACT|nr:hypothetical protein [Pelagicoccus enzymogenes]MBD5779445.1 hypothetical protein [Pelagicoccus enzymogenes]
MDISILHKDTDYQLVGVDRKKLSLQGETDTVDLPRKKAGQIRLVPKTRMSEHIAGVGEIQAIQKNSPLTDPKLVWQSAVSKMENDARIQEDQVRANVYARMQAAAMSGGNTTAVFNQGIDEIESAMEQTSRIEDFAQQMPADMKAPFDAVQLTFDLQLPPGLEAPYLVAFVDYQEPGKQPIIRRPIFRELDAKETNIQTITIDEDGFPLDFTLLGTSVAVYDGNQEIATIRSPKIVGLPRSEAIKFMRNARANKSPSGSLAAAPIPLFAPSNFLNSLDSKILDTQIEVSTDANGRAQSLKIISPQKSKLESDVRRLLLDVPFYPALESGQPIKSKVTLKIRDFIS